MKSGLPADKVFVYAIQCGEYIKIGQTETPKKRFAALKGANPYDMEYLGHVIAEPALEGHLHRYLEADRRRLEWFNITPRVRRVADLIVGNDLDSIYVMLGFPKPSERYVKL